ncbi:MAG: galactokinase [Chitinophagaceae bacterium]
MSIASNIRNKFRNIFNEEPLVVRSPGRVNIIGEHTDYNNGFVLPAAIDKAIYVAVTKRNDDSINLYSDDFDELVDFHLQQLQPEAGRWTNYVLGVVDQLLKHGYTLQGFNLAVGGDVPIGAGLSSSAAVECSTIFALNEIFNLNISKLEMVKRAQKAEHEFSGVMCGIMDQFASMYGKKDHVIKLDCLTLDYEYVPLKLDGIKVVLLNTNVKHSLASSEYNTRRAQCEEGVTLVKKHFSEVTSLRDVTLDMLDKHVAPVDELIYQRCKYVIEENLRLLAATEDLKAGNIEALGQKMFQTHEGLSKQYEVSCKELDFLVNAVSNDADVLGARMMGGGFGGCTINLIKEDAVGKVIEKVGNAYSENMQKETTTYTTQIEDGTSITRE